MVQQLDPWSRSWESVLAHALCRAFVPILSLLAAPSLPTPSAALKTTSVDKPLRSVNEHHTGLRTRLALNISSKQTINRPAEKHTKDTKHTKHTFLSALHASVGQQQPACPTWRRHYHPNSIARPIGVAHLPSGTAYIYPDRPYWTTHYHSRASRRFWVSQFLVTRNLLVGSSARPTHGRRSGPSDIIRTTAAFVGKARLQLSSTTSRRLGTQCCSPAPPGRRSPCRTRAIGYPGSHSLYYLEPLHSDVAPDHFCTYNIMTSTAVSSAGGHASRTSSRPDCRFPAVNKRLTAPWAMILVVFLCLVSHALAASPDAAAPVETLVIYHRPPHHEDQRWAVSPEHEIRRRQVQKRATLDEPEEGDSTESDEPEEADSTESSEPSKTSASHSVTTTFTIGAGLPKTSTTSTTVAASPLPSILDNVPSGFFSPGPNNGPAPCPIFINSFLDNPDFKRCYPISMLIQVSVTREPRPPPMTNPRDRHPAPSSEPSNRLSVLHARWTQPAPPT